MEELELSEVENNEEEREAVGEPLDLRILTNVCQHCHNWFNADNTPRDFYQERNEASELGYFENTWIPNALPFPFVDLVREITSYTHNEDNAKTSTTKENIGPIRMEKDLTFTAWQNAFKEELRYWCRLVTI